MDSQEEGVGVCTCFLSKGLSLWLLSSWGRALEKWRMCLGVVVSRDESLQHLNQSLRANRQLLQDSLLTRTPWRVRVHMPCCHKNFTLSLSDLNCWHSDILYYAFVSMLFVCWFLFVFPCIAITSLPCYVIYWCLFLTHSDHVLSMFICVNCDTRALCWCSVCVLIFVNHN